MSNTVAFSVKPNYSITHSDTNAINIFVIIWINFHAPNNEENITSTVVTYLPSI